MAVVTKKCNYLNTPKIYYFISTLVNKELVERGGALWVEHSVTA